MEDSGVDSAAGQLVDDAADAGDAAPDRGDGEPDEALTDAPFDAPDSSTDAGELDGAGDATDADATANVAGPGSGSWGSLVITGTNLPAEVMSVFKPNRLPVRGTSLEGAITWTESQATAASPSDLPTVEISVTVTQDGALVQPSATRPFTLFLHTHGHGGAGVSAGVTLDNMARKVTFKDAIVISQDLGVSWTAVLNGELYYSDYPAQPGTTVTSAALKNTTCPPLDSGPSGVTFDDIQCVVGVYRGFSNQSTVCTVVVDAKARTIRFTDVGVDATIGWVGEATDAGLKTNLITMAAYQVSIHGAQDRIELSIFWPSAGNGNKGFFEVDLGYAPGPGNVQMNTCRVFLP